jgi:hypothetical protein
MHTRRNKLDTQKPAAPNALYSLFHTKHNPLRATHSANNNTLLKTSSIPLEID